jgi:hypothetical protein
LNGSEAEPTMELPPPSHPGRKTGALRSGLTLGL